ncbi:MAG: sugar phosphate isomerase/epimerase [Lentisphaerae bacterium]|nr:sugar phosphate isomerase/epimerase [Lentisphaerota bacterium]
MKPLALQLYTVREGAAVDFPGTIRRVAEIGYKGIEFAGLHGHDPKEIAELVNDLGLKVCSSHAGVVNEENFQQIVETERTLGNTRIIGGFGSGQFTTIEGCNEAIKAFNKAAELLKSQGMTAGIHNHWWEFEKLNGRLIFDIIMEDAPNTFSELDVYWTAYAKSDPVEIINRHKSRMPVLHIKDGSLEEKAPHLAVGSGVLDIPAIVGAADPNVLKWLIVELDNFAGDMWEAVQSSYDYLTSNGLASGNK